MFVYSTLYVVGLHIWTSGDHLWYSRILIIWTLDDLNSSFTVLSEYLSICVCSIGVVQRSSVYESVGFIYLNKFTYLNTLVIRLAQSCSNNEGPTVQITENHACITLKLCVSNRPLILVHLLLEKLYSNKALTILIGRFWHLVSQDFR